MFTDRARGIADKERAYDAFVSYSHHDDHDLASALQAGLQRFAKRWYQLRSLRVFRDEASLTANPALWDSIQRALSSSKWFVILASASAARSEWVNREIDWWLANRSPERLLIVATSPGVAWDKRAGDWAADAPVPPALRGVLEREPRVADLTGVARTDRRLRLSDDAVADVAAPIHGKPKDDLVGDHVREHRRTLRLARGAVVGLSVLTAAAIAASVIAVGQRSEAQNQARLATARELAALSEANLGTNLGLAQLLAVAAYKMDADDQTQDALFQAVAASPHLVRYLQAGDPVQALGTSANGNVVVAGTGTGRLVRFDLAAGRRQSEPTGLTAINQVAVSGDGSTVAATDGHETVVWNADAKYKPHRFGGDGAVSGIAISPSGRYAAFVHSSSSSQNSVTLADTATGSQVSTTVPAALDEVMFSSRSAVTVFNGGGGWEELGLAGLRKIGQGGEFQAPANGYITGTSPDGGYSAYVTHGSVYAWNTVHTGRDHVANDIAPFSSATSLAISPDGTRAAVVVGGTIYLGQLTATPAPGSSPAAGTDLAANGDTTDVSFLGGDNHLVSATGDSVALWNLLQTSRIEQPTGVSVPIAAMYGFPPTLEFTPDGKELVLLGGDGGASMYRLGKKYTETASWGAEGGSNLLIWDGGKPLFLQPGARNMDVVNFQGHVLRPLPDPGEQSYVITARAAPDGSAIVTVDQSGTISVLTMRRGLIKRIAGHANGLQAQQIAISADGQTVAESEQAQRQVVLVSLATGARTVVGTGEADGVLFAGDRLLIQRSSGALEVWDEAGRHMLDTLPAGGGFADALAVSPDGSLVARLSDDGNVTITSLSTGEVLASFNLPVPADNGMSDDPWLGTALQFTPDGRSLLTASTGGELIRWNVYYPALVQIACSIAGRALTGSQWRQYAHSAPPAVLPCAR
jgi:WD40 repeat protein